MTKSSMYRGLFVLAILVPVSNVMSEGASYDYAQFTYISSTVDLGASADDIEGDGIGLSVSLSFAPTYAMKLTVAATTFKTFQGMGVDTSKLTALGVTAHTSVASRTDIFANLSAVKAVITATDGVDSISETDIGGAIKIGLRHRVIDALEIELAASHVDVFGEKVNAYALDTRFYIRKRVSLGVGYSASDDVHSLLLRARMDL